MKRIFHPASQWSTNELPMVKVSPREAGSWQGCFSLICCIREIVVMLYRHTVCSRINRKQEENDKRKVTLGEWATGNKLQNRCLLRKRGADVSGEKRRWRTVNVHVRAFLWDVRGHLDAAQLNVIR